MTQWNNEGQPPPYQSYDVTPIGGEQVPDQAQPYSAQPYPAQPYPAQPYQAQPHPAQPYSAQPYSAQPYSAQPYAQPFSAPPQPAYGPYQPPPPLPPSPRRSARVFALIGSLVVLAVVAVGIVVVIAIRRQADDKKPADNAAPAASTATSAAATQAGPIDMCLVGNWKQSEYKSTFDFTDLAPDGKSLGKVKVTGSGVQQEITAEGDSVSDYSSVTYTGRSSDGRTVTLLFSGQYRQTLKTSNHQILFSAKAGTMTMTVMVDNKQVLKNNPTGTSNPQPYTCGDNRWTTTSLVDPDAGATFVRSY
ncbi:hypothetical protein ACPPVO_55655 [Dactylosporangium sp. McL0621]|uniref:hypothetical protein n=1 Tax=Dactylosporangium sp. McL0621 TaxID=3415678 RepID=UPI003CF21529